VVRIVRVLAVGVGVVPGRGKVRGPLERREVVLQASLVVLYRAILLKKGTWTWTEQRAGPAYGVLARDLAHKGR